MIGWREHFRMARQMLNVFFPTVNLSQSVPDLVEPDRPTLPPHPTQRLAPPRTHPMASPLAGVVGLAAAGPWPSPSSLPCLLSRPSDTSASASPHPPCRRRHPRPRRRPPRGVRLAPRPIP